MSKELDGKLFDENTLAEAKKRMADLEANNKLGELESKLAEYEERFKKQEKMLSEYAELNSKLFLKVGASIKTESEEPAKSPEEIEQEELVKSAMAKIEAINNANTTE